MSVWTVMGSPGLHPTSHVNNMMMAVISAALLVAAVAPTEPGPSRQTLPLNAVNGLRYPRGDLASTTTPQAAPASEAPPSVYACSETGYPSTAGSHQGAAAKAAVVDVCIPLMPGRSLLSTPEGHAHLMSASWAEYEDRSRHTAGISCSRLMTAAAALPWLAEQSPLVDPRQGWHAVCHMRESRCCAQAASSPATSAGSASPLTARLTIFW